MEFCRRLMFVQVICQVMLELSFNCIVFTTRVNQNAISDLLKKIPHMPFVEANFFL